MYGTYGSIIGVSNIIFTISMIALSIKFWNQVNILFKILLIIGVLLFIIIQPMAVYIKSKKQVKSFPKDMTINFNDKGIYIRDSNQDLEFKWKDIREVVNKPSMIIIFTKTKHGFIVTDEMVGDKKEDFYKYLIEKI